MDIAALLEEQEGNQTVMASAHKVLRQVQHKLGLTRLHGEPLTWEELQDNIKCCLAGLEMSINGVE